ncbi:hypothetical protein Nepgr_029440 [Nepenthes gracilis]|uniref:DNA-directed RNA polymerase III subunit RPC6 n=1 Tax=Nepenthes gracilis TaxID=150966 RepID=A0AAD3Y306_NEPGR|nr:hypothetical protein Nepgr_029440 [Nepenthes gracilis]
MCEVFEGYERQNCELFLTIKLATFLDSEGRVMDAKALNCAKRFGHSYWDPMNMIQHAPSEGIFAQETENPAEMSRLRGAMSLKRKRSGPEDPSNQLTNDERAVFNLIRSKGDMGIWKGDMKRELRSINARVVDNCIKSLQAKRVIKEVVNIQSKGKNRLMSMEFEPSKELTGGAWYNEGNLDMEFITYLKKLCLGGIRKLKVATADGIQIHDMIKKSGAFKVDVSIQQIQDILKNLVLENEIFEVKSTGSGEFAHMMVSSPQPLVFTTPNGRNFERPTHVPQSMIVLTMISSRWIMSISSSTRYLLVVRYAVERLPPIS